MGGRGHGRVRERQTNQTASGGPAKATLERQTRFLEKLVECDGNIIRACRRAKVSRAMHYHWFDNEATYKDRYDYARRIIFDQMESELFDRAKVSDMLFRFALESRFPDMYGKKLKLDGAAPVHSLDPEKLKALTDQELDTLIRLSKKVAVQQA